MDALTLVSYNISFAAPSFVAPDRALRAREAPRLLREECLRSHPDIIALQESPNESWGGVAFGPEYVSVGTRLASHVEGHIDLLVRRDLARHARWIALEHPALPLPSVAAAITLPNGTRVVACSLHLPHTKEGATARELMCEAIMQIISQQSSNFILIGDFNMRENEDGAIENLVGGGWIDAWKEATGKDKSVKFSWDSRTNLFHEPGPSSFQFIARFDRCYVRGIELEARQFDLIGNQPIDGRKGDYLSDHYGIVVKVGVARSSSLAANLVVKESNGNKNADGSMNDACMVDLTGDSDSDDVDAGMPSKRKRDENGSSDSSSRNKAYNSTDSKRNGGISTEEMRRLRLKKLSGTAVASAGQKSNANGRKTSQPSTIASSSILRTHNLTSPSSSNKAACQSEEKRTTEVASTSGDIEPMKPVKFTIDSGKLQRYIIYMAIREKKESDFARGLAKCREACHDEVKHCLQMAGTRHVSMWNGNLTSEQAKKLTFNGRFAPFELKLEGWQPWDSGCYLELNEESEGELQDLLAKMNGLPSGGKRPCDHLSLYRKRPQTHHPNPEREFGKIREATRSHNWGSVEGVSIRIKSFGSPYDNCLVLAGEGCQHSLNKASKKLLSLHNSYSQPTRNDGEDSELKSNQCHQRNDQWNDECNSDGDQNKKSEKDRKTTDIATFRDHSSKNSSIPLFIVSWNISETSLNQISAAAPDPSRRAQESACLIREECFRPHFASQQQNEKTFLPDIIALQECPDELWGEAVFGPSGYVSVGTQHSHCGLIDLLVRKDFAYERILLKDLWTEHSRFDDFDQHKLPSVAAIFTLPNKTAVAVASNHLEPHASGASSRAQQFKLLMEDLMHKCGNVILIGDMNMRQKEDRKIENLVGGGWTDAWKGAGSSKKLKYSWDSFTNSYHLNGFGFTARFDRAYVRGKELLISDFGLVGNQPINGVQGDYLSDHFGLIVNVDVDPSSDQDVKRVETAEAGDRDDEGVDFKATAMDRRSRNYSNDSNGASQPLQSTESETAHAIICASPQEPEHDHKLQHKCEKQYGDWGSDLGPDDKMVSKETPCRADGKRARSAMAKGSISMKTNSNESNTAQFMSFRGSKKENNSKATPKKKFKFQSSSSDDDEEDLRRMLQEKLGKKYKRRKLQHLPNDTSSDED